MAGFEFENVILIVEEFDIDFVSSLCQRAKANLTIFVVETTFARKLWEKINGKFSRIMRILKFTNGYLSFVNWMDTFIHEMMTCMSFHETLYLIIGAFIVSLISIYIASIVSS